MIKQPAEKYSRLVLDTESKRCTSKKLVVVGCGLLLAILLLLGLIGLLLHFKFINWDLNIVDSGCPITLCGVNCFSFDSMVYRYNNKDNIIESVLLSDIKSNDLIMSNLNGDFSKVLYDLFDNNTSASVSAIPMNKICFEEDNGNDSCLIAGNNHLLFVNGTNIDNIIPSKDVKIGDFMYDINDPDTPVCSIHLL